MIYFVSQKWKVNIWTARNNDEDAIKHYIELQYFIFII